MRNTYSVNGKEILIHAPGNSKMNKIKNDLLWDINSFLSTQFELFVFFVCRTPTEAAICRLASSFPKKYVTFQKLDDMFIRPKVLNDDEVNLYREIIDPSRKVNDDVFKEMCCVENVDMEYVAVEDVDQLLNFSAHGSRAALTRRIRSLFPAYISVFGAKEMRIVINRSSLFKPIQSIVLAHCVKET